MALCRWPLMMFYGSPMVDIEPQKVLSICLFSDVALPSIGGAQTVLDALAQRLQALGHAPVVLAPSPRQPWNDAALSYRVVRHRRLISKRFAVRLLLFKLIRLHAIHRFDLIHCHAAYPQAYVAMYFSRLFKIPYVVRPHGSDVLPGDLICSNPRLEKRVCLALRHADAVIAQGQSMRQAIQRLGVHDRQIVTIHNGVDLSLFAQAKLFDHPRPYALAMSSLVPHKGLDILLRAWGQVVSSCSLDLLIAGTGPELETLTELALKLGIADRVRWLGVVTGPDKRALLRSARMFIATPRREPFSNSLLEAIAAGLPIIATAVDGNLEIVQPNINGLLCAPESEQDVADAIYSLASGTILREHLARGSQQRAETFNWDRIVLEYIFLYREVLCGVN